MSICITLEYIWLIIYYLLPLWDESISLDVAHDIDRYRDVIVCQLILFQSCEHMYTLSNVVIIIFKFARARPSHSTQRKDCIR